MTLRSAIKWLLVLAVSLPVLQAALLWVAGLLAAMGDDAAAGVVRHVSTGAGVTWLVSLVGLVVTLAVDSLNRPPD